VPLHVETYLLRQFNVGSSDLRNDSAREREGGRGRDKTRKEKEKSCFVARWWKLK
jgi:hypothetical protein